MTEINPAGTYKLGKAPAKRDPRNLMLSTVLTVVPVPPAYDADDTRPGLPMPMFANDTYGDCVMAGRAHQTLRFKYDELKRVVAISDQEVLDEYFKETGGSDTGLVVLDSLKHWRRPGWLAAGAKDRIRAFAQVLPTNHDLFRAAVFNRLGVGIGIAMPISAQRQIGGVWDVVSGPGSSPGSWGGHYVYVPAYTEQGPICVTWGARQPMTWAFVDAYVDEAYAIFDLRETHRAINNVALQAYLDRADAMPSRSAVEG